MKSLHFITLVFVLTLLSHATKAQTEARKVLVGGSSNFGFSSTKGGNQEIQIFTLSPTIGLFVVDNLALGGIVDIRSQSFNSSVDFIQPQPIPQQVNIRGKESTTSVLSFLRYYLEGEKFKLYLQVAYGVGKSKNTFEVPSTGSTNFIAYNMSIGETYVISKSVMLDLSLNYNSRKPEGSNERINTLALNLGVFVSI